jgi:aconitate hydratase
MLPLVCKKFDFEVGDYIYIENIIEAVKNDNSTIKAKHISGKKVKEIYLELGTLTKEEKEIILKGCLINYNKVK